MKLFKAGIEAPIDLKFGKFFGTSDNPWDRFDITDARNKLGYAPQEDAYKIAVVHARKPWIHIWRCILRRLIKLLVWLGFRQQMETL